MENKISKLVAWVKNRNINLVSVDEHVLLAHLKIANE